MYKKVLILLFLFLFSYCLLKKYVERLSGRLYSGGNR